MFLKHFEVLGGKTWFAVVSCLITVEIQSFGLEILTELYIQKFYYCACILN